MARLVGSIRRTSKRKSFMRSRSILCRSERSDLRETAQARSSLRPILLKVSGPSRIAHFLIHIYDFPPLAEKGLAAARAYVRTRAFAAHALHMPSHIFTRVCAWEDSGRRTRAPSRPHVPTRGARSARPSTTGYCVPPDGHERGREENDRARGEDAAKFGFFVRLGHSRSRRFRRAMRWSAALEAAAQLPLKQRTSLCDAITHIARASVRRGPATLPRRGPSSTLGRVARSACRTKNSYWRDQVEIQLLGICMDERLQK